MPVFLCTLRYVDRLWCRSPARRGDKRNDPIRCPMHLLFDPTAGSATPLGTSIATTAPPQPALPLRGWMGLINKTNLTMVEPFPTWLLEMQFWDNLTLIVKDCEYTATLSDTPHQIRTPLVPQRPTYGILSLHSLFLFSYITHSLHGRQPTISPISSNHERIQSVPADPPYRVCRVRTHRKDPRFT